MQAGAERMVVQKKPDMDSQANIELFVEKFYAQLLQDEKLAPIFFDVAEIDLEVHLPHIKAYWCKLLLQQRGYARHTMNIHRAVHAKQALTLEDFDRWIALFVYAVDQYFCGEYAEKAKRIARSIVGNMQESLSVCQGGVAS